MNGRGPRLLWIAPGRSTREVTMGRLFMGMLAMGSLLGLAVALGWLARNLI